MPERSEVEEFFRDSRGAAVATTMVYSRMLAKLLKDENIGKLIVPIIPDEARTFGMDSLFRQAGIYASRGQLVVAWALVLFTTHPNATKIPWVSRRQQISSTDRRNSKPRSRIHPDAEKVSLQP